MAVQIVLNHVAVQWLEQPNISIDVTSCDKIENVEKGSPLRPGSIITVQWGSLENVYPAIYLGSSDSLKAIDKAVDKLVKAANNFDPSLKSKFGLMPHSYFETLLNINPNDDEKEIRTPVIVEKKIKLQNSKFRKRPSVRIRTRSRSSGSEAETEDGLVTHPKISKKRPRRSTESDDQETGTDLGETDADSDKEQEKKGKEKAARKMRRSNPPEQFVPVRTPLPSPVTPSQVFFARPSAMEHTPGPAPSTPGCEPAIKDIFYMLRSMQKTLDNFQHSFRIMNDRQSAMDARLIALQSTVASLGQNLIGGNRAVTATAAAPTTEEQRGAKRRVGHGTYKAKKADEVLMEELRNDGRLKHHSIQKHTDFLRTAMEYQFGEDSYRDTVLYCHTAAGKGKFGHASGMKEYPGRFTDSLIVVCAKQFDMELSTVRESLKALIRRKRDAILKVDKDTEAEMADVSNSLASTSTDSRFIW